MAATISAVVFSKNSQKTIEICLTSVRFAQEVILVDMGATDQTVTLAKPYLDALYLKAADYVEPVRNFGISKAHGEWLLIIDADEEVPLLLAQRIRQKIETREWKGAVAIPRQNMIFGRAVQHTGWWPDYQVRLFPKGAASWNETIHATPNVNGSITYLEARRELALIHHHISTVDEYLSRIVTFTRVEADQRTSNRPEPLTAFFDEVINRYYAQEGYKDKAVGTYLSFLQGFYQFLVQLRLWEKAGFSEHFVNLEKALDQFGKARHYWHCSQKIQTANSSGARLFWRLRRKAGI